ncbi:MAG: trypsin-like peptidase domain-containing protein [Planctomycetota bacterium]
MRLGSLIFVLCFLFGVDQFDVFAQDRAVIQRGKAATLLVDLGEDQSATAFCVHESGIFVTNHHVVEEASSDTLELVADVGLETEKRLKATVIRSDEDTDLALLRAESLGKFVALPLGSDDAVYETMQSIAFGFPFGKQLAVDEEATPAMSVSVGRITAIRRKRGVPERFQLDAEINPGNSGGPVIDEEGNVVGVVSSGVFATGISFAIPVSKLSKLMAVPDVDITYPQLTTKTASEPAKLLVRVTSLIGSSDEYVPEATARVNGLNVFQIALKPLGHGAFSGEFTPAPRDASTWRLPVEIKFKDGAVSGGIAAKPLRVNGKDVELSDIESIRTNDDGRTILTLVNGDESEANVEGLNRIDVTVGNNQLQLDASAAKSIEVSAPLDIEVEYAVVVKKGNQELARLSESQIISSVESTVGSMSGKPATAFRHGKRVIPMPATISDVVSAAGGRKLLVVLETAKKVAVVDVPAGKIEKLVSLPSDQVIVVGTANHFFVFDLVNQIVQRLPLSSLKEDLTVKVPFSGVVKAVAAGSNSNGPLLVHWASGTSALARASYSLLDPKTLTPIEVENARFRNNSFRDAVHMRASHDGKVFGLWATSHSPQGLGVAVLSESRFEHRYEHDSVGHIVPGPKGMHLFTGSGGVLNQSLSSYQRGNRALPCIPTSHPKLYLTVPAEPGAQRNLGPRPFAGIKPSVMVVGSNQPLAQLPALDLGVDNENPSWSRSDFTLDKRVAFLMESNALVSVPFSNDKLVIQEFELEKYLDESSLDYFFVSSIAPQTFERGATYRYRSTVSSKRSGVKYKLTNGPKGMRVSSRGEVTWQVPSSFTETSVDVIITVTNSADQIVYDSFTLTAE